MKFDIITYIVYWIYIKSLMYANFLVACRFHWAVAYSLQVEYATDTWKKNSSHTVHSRDRGEHENRRCLASFFREDATELRIEIVDRRFSRDLAEFRISREAERVRSKP